jgi:Kdo2-lipid IVA lauroyltransferase/acyltransferase
MTTLDPTLPVRWRTTQRWKNTLLFGVIKTVVTVLQKLPFVFVRACLRGLMLVAPLLARKDTRLARKQLREFLPEMDAKKTTRHMYQHLATSLAEILHLDSILPRVTLDADSQQALRSALSEGKGVVAVTGHIGNWELLAQSIVQSGFPLTTFAKPLYDPRLTQLVNDMRTRQGMQVLWRGEGSVSKSILRVFRQNRILAFLIDQDTKVPGIFVPFFSQPAFTPSAPALLALKTGAPMVLGWHHRQGESHTIKIERYYFAPSGDLERDVELLTTQWSLRLEQLIRQAPEQWVWLHKRWR